MVEASNMVRKESVVFSINKSCTLYLLWASTKPALHMKKEQRQEGQKFVQQSQIPKVWEREVLLVSQ